jgi:hypothetical protein
MMQLAHVCHSKLALKSSNHLAQELVRGGGENNVIHVQQQVGSIRTPAICKEGAIRLGLCKSKGSQVGSKPVMPSTGRLLQSIE